MRTPYHPHSSLQPLQVALPSPTSSVHTGSTFAKAISFHRKWWRSSNPDVARAGSFVLGAPLLTDVFHADRWDYVYRFQPGKGKLQERKLTVIFENGSLARLEGDVRPEEAGTQ
jgi:hypothetical protein